MTAPNGSAQQEEGLPGASREQLSTVADKPDCPVTTKVFHSKTTPGLTILPERVFMPPTPRSEAGIHSRNHVARLVGLAGPEAAVLTPACYEAPTGTNGQGFEGQASAAGPNADAQRAVVQTDKELATMHARLALSGYTLHLIGDGKGGCAYLVGRWSLSRTLPDREALVKFIENVWATQ